MNLLRQKHALIALLLAWSSWLTTAVEGPKMLCLESGSEIRVESPASGCCTPASLEAVALSFLGGNAKCGDCGITVLELVPMTRAKASDGSDTQRLTSITPVSVVLIRPATQGVDPDTLRGGMSPFVLPGDAPQFSPGIAPLLC